MRKDDMPHKSEGGGSQAHAEQHEVAEHLLGNCGDKGGGELVFENLAEAERLGFSLEPPGGKVDAGQKVLPPHLIRKRESSLLTTYWSESTQSS